jgi:hypothetical protein
MPRGQEGGRGGTGVYGGRGGTGGAQGSQPHLGLQRLGRHRLHQGAAEALQPPRVERRHPPLVGRFLLRTFRPFYPLLRPLCCCHGPAAGAWQAEVASRVGQATDERMLAGGARLQQPGQCEDHLGVWGAWGSNQGAAFHTGAVGGTWEGLFMYGRHGVGCGGSITSESAMDPSDGPKLSANGR